MAAEATLGDLLQEGTTAENVQARLRAMILMSFVNRYGGMLLNTSTKTELALGYATLYGDMAGTLGPIADVTKPEVVALARWINSVRGLIPPFILERPPSAELRPAQIDPFDYATVAAENDHNVNAIKGYLWGKKLGNLYQRTGQALAYRAMPASNIFGIMAIYLAG